MFHNYPNPFNPETWIPFQLESDAPVSVSIYDMLGSQVRTIEHLSAGYYLNKDRAVYWDGRNASGERVASGTYFYQFQSGTTVKTSKMVILK
jgi:flagellar hook assembly protein FlgD